MVTAAAASKNTLDSSFCGCDMSNEIKCTHKTYTRVCSKHLSIVLCCYCMEINEFNCSCLCGWHRGWCFVKIIEWETFLDSPWIDLRDLIHFQLDFNPQCFCVHTHKFICNEIKQGTLMRRIFRPKHLIYRIVRSYRRLADETEVHS